MSVPTQRSGWAQPVIQVDDDGNALTPAAVGFTYGFVNGTSTGLSDGDCSDWYAIRNSSDNDPSDVLNTAASILTYFDTDAVAFDATPVWIKIPIWDAAVGWSTFAVTVRNRMGVSMRLDVYAVPEKGLVNVNAPIVNSIAYHSIVAALDVPEASSTTFGPAGTSLSAVSMWPVGWLVIKMTPASDPPGSGYWTLAVTRGR